jgi:hypothetical protein
MRTRQAFTKGTHYPNRPGGGRTWWAHFEFTRINIEPIILKNKIEDVREARASRSIAGGRGHWSAHHILSSRSTDS